jgi:hypothetical protein
MFKIKKACGLLTATDHASRVVYIKEGSQVCVDTLASYLASDLDAKGAIRVCLIYPQGSHQATRFQKFRYNHSTDKFDKI